jgi:hypothetical protein
MLHIHWICVLFGKSIQESNLADGFVIHPRIVSNSHIFSYCHAGELKALIPVNLPDNKNRSLYEEFINADGDINPIIVKFNFK